MIILPVYRKDFQLAGAGFEYIVSYKIYFFKRPELLAKPLRLFRHFCPNLAHHVRVRLNRPVFGNFSFVIEGENVGIH